MNTSEIRKENLINLYNEKGKRHGYWEAYWNNGQLRYKGNYVDGKLHGYWEFYFSNGELYYKCYYDMGEQVDYNPDEPKIIELTLSDIASKLGVDVDKLRIKE